MDAMWRAFESAAYALSKCPAADNDYALQKQICAEYGVFLESCTEDEIHYLESLTAEYIGGSR